MKSIKKIILGIVIFLVVLVFAKNLIAKMAIESGVGMATGLPLKMGKFDFSLTKSYVGITDLRLQNPKGFPDKVMVDMPEIYIDFNVSDLLKGKLHLESVRIHLKEFLVEKNQNGELNLNALTAIQESKSATKPETKRSMDQKKGKSPEMQIDSLLLKVEKVVYKDFTNPAQPSSKDFNINLNEAYSNITNPTYVVSLIVMKIMMTTPIAVLSNFDVSGLQNSVAGALATSTEIANEAAARASIAAAQASAALQAKAEEAKALLAQSENLKAATSTLNVKAKDVAGNLQETAANLKEKFKLPFGSKE